jgi:hypothetical protein
MTQEAVPQTRNRPSTAAGHARVPVLLETVYTVTIWVVVLLGAATAFISFLADGNVLMMLVRAGSAMLVLGLLGWFLYYRVARSAIEIVRQQAREEAEAAAEAREQAASLLDIDA